MIHLLNPRATVALMICVSLSSGRVYSQTPAPAASIPDAYTRMDNKAGLTANGGFWGFRKAPNPDLTLPRVLCIGDSISLGYYGEVTKRLKGKANVDRYATGMNIGLGDPFYGQLQDALSHGPYDVIHFNDIGLHGFAPRGPQTGRIADDKYEGLLKTYVDYIRAHSQGATLIWADTTPLTVKGNPAQLDPANSKVVERNKIAATVMKEFGIPTDDLYTLMLNHLDLAIGDQYHWKPAGQTLQGRQVAESVEAALTTRPVNFRSK